MKQSDTFFKTSSKNIEVSYSQWKSYFSQGYFIIYFYVCVQELFSVLVENFPRLENFICYGIFRISVSHRVQTHFLKVPCVISQSSSQLGQIFKSESLYKHIYFEWNNSNYKKNKRFIILMLKNTCVMRNRV